MAGEAVADGIGGDLGRACEPAARPMARSRSDRIPLLFIILLNLLVVGAGAGGYVLVSPGASSGKGPDLVPGEQAANAVRAAPVTYDLPDLLVNLNTGSGTSSVLKITVALELEDESAIHRLQTVMPRILDNFQVYLSEFRIEDLSGPAGIERLSEELLLRVNAAIQPAEARDVLVKDMRVQ